MKMPYPFTPFNESFNTEILLKHQNFHENKQIENLNLNEILKWLCTAPKITSYRVNTLTHSTEDVFNTIYEKMNEILDIPPKIQNHDILSDVIILHNLNIENLDLQIKTREVIIDVYCATAVLRGANIFAPGIIGMQSGTKVGEKVSIYVDIAKECKRGFQKVYNSSKKVFIGNGIAKMARHELFAKNIKPTGVAVEVYSSISGCPNISVDIIPKHSCVLQNLPSIICTQILKPQPGDIILDMCASPGNKTTHIAAITNNEGILIAIDKTPTKIKQLRNTCNNFYAKVNIFQADSTKIYGNNTNICNVLCGPPFNSESFNRILLDAPCSALGQRPQFYNNISEKVLQSYVPLQKKLFENAVHLLKVNGYLVYSTCTITIAENEGMVEWALKKYGCISLVRPEPYLGSQGWKGTNLTDAQLQCLQRFGPDTKTDSVGFFIACFIKEKKST